VSAAAAARFDHVAFDLDGTLIDSRADLAAATNHVLRTFGLPEIPPRSVYELVGEAPVYAVAMPEARTRAEPRIDTERRRQDGAAFFDPASSQQMRDDILRRRDVDYVLVDRQTQSDVLPQLLEDPMLREVYRGRRFVILRVAR